MPQPSSFSPLVKPTISQIGNNARVLDLYLYKVHIFKRWLDEHKNGGMEMDDTKHWGMDEKKMGEMDDIKKWKGDGGDARPKANVTPG